jgi:hypothetical protein
MLALLFVQASLGSLVVLVNFRHEAGVQLWFGTLGNGDMLYVPTGFLKLEKIGAQAELHVFMLDVVRCLSFMYPLLVAHFFESAERKHKPYRRACLRIAPVGSLEFAFDFSFVCGFSRLFRVGMLGDY